MDPELVAGRECGECHVCCVALTVDTPDLQKLPGHRCPHARQDYSCGVYADRFPVCRTFFCGWRMLDFVPETLRPDRSSVLIWHSSVRDGNGEMVPGLVLSLMSRAALKAEGLAEAVMRAISAGIPLYLSIPGPPGYGAGDAPMNEYLGEAVRSGNKARVLDLLRRARQRGLAGPFRPVVLRHRSGSAAGPTD